MIAVIIVEYNPLHNGHIYHIEQTKSILNQLNSNGDNHIIAIMSGNFTQRGNIAILNKYTRAKHAIMSGVDMVIELPSIYATSSAEYFANGAMQIAKKITGADIFCFGAETDNIEQLEKIADYTQTNEYNSLIQKHLKDGLSYPISSELALKTLSDIPSQIYNMPNNILGIEYIKQAKKLELNIKPYAIKRQGSGYNDINFDNTFNSAKAIRNALTQSDLTAEQLKVPNYVFEDVKNSNIDYDKLMAIISAKAIENTQIYEDTEGILNRIKKFNNVANSYQELLDLAHTKRYTKSKITRIFAHIALNHTQKDLLPIGKPNVLAIKANKKHLLSKIDFSGDFHHINLDNYANKIYNIVASDKIKCNNMLIVD